MECVDGNCVDVPSEDVSDSEEDVMDSFILPETDSGESGTSTGGGSFIIDYEEPGVKVEEGSSCSVGSGESAFIVWLLFCLGILYIGHRKS
jgi:hypothetical protein